jgi:large subunit ribosomal protein L1
MARSKKYKEAKEKIDSKKEYSLDEAIKLAQETSISKFDGSVDVTINLNLKDKEKKQAIKGSIVFPNSFATETKVAVLADTADQKKAKAAGADVVGLDDLMKKIEEGFRDFDVLIATPDVMPKIAQLGKYIGKLGLMPNPKSGTVAKNVEEAIKSFKAGKINFKMSDSGTFQQKIGKTSMDDAQIKENFLAFFKSLSSEVSNLGKEKIKAVLLCSTMGPSVKVDVNSFLGSI